jgi:hypothetical protein
MKDKKKRLITLVIGIATGVVGFSGFVALRYSDAYTRTNQQLKHYRIVLSGSSMTYATLRSYDPATRSLEAERLNQYDAAGQPSILRIPLQEDAFIGYQEVFSDGTRSFLSSTTPKTMSDIASLPAGTKLKFLTATGSGNVAIIYLLFGNPL